MGFLFEGDAVSATPAGKYIWHVRRHQMSIGRITVPRITEEIFDTKFYEQPLSKRSLTCWGFLRHIHGRPWAVLRCRTAEPPWGWLFSFFANHHLPTWCAMSTIRCRTTSGRGRPLTNTPPSWLTPPWPAMKENKLFGWIQDNWWQEESPGTPDSASLTQCGEAFLDLFHPKSVLRDSDSLTKARFPGFT